MHAYEEASLTRRHAQRNGKVFVQVCRTTILSIRFGDKCLREQHVRRDMKGIKPDRQNQQMPVPLPGQNADAADSWNVVRTVENKTADCSQTRKGR